MFVQEAGGLLRIWCFFTSIAELSTLSPAMNKKGKHWYNEDAEMWAVMTADDKTNLIYTKK